MDEETAQPSSELVENLLGLRIVAGIIDLVVLLILGAVFTQALGDTTSDDGGVSFNLSGVPFIAYIAACFAYYLVFETAKGQTPGKMVAKIKVVSEIGPLSVQKVLVRTALRVVDGLPYFLPNLVAVIATAATPKHQRLGDIAAGTLVVRA
jgi:uncharacterized RDD family membrane protein YckC